MKQLILSVGVLLLCVSGALAQLPTGTILGEVKDPSGAVVPGADVTARETQTNQTRKIKTGADGTYRFNTLPVGDYEITVGAPGFQTAVQTGLTLTLGQEAASSFTLQVGAESTRIEVSTETTNLIDTTTSSVGSLVNQEQIADLPLNGRNYNDLTLLQTGVTKSVNSNISQIGYNGTAYSSNGATQRSNMYLLDGALQASLSGNNGSSALGTTLGVDGILEFKVITSSFDAEYGMVMGSTMTIVSKSGTNKFHGTAFDFLRNSALDARNYFDLPPSRLLGPTGKQHRNPEFRRNQFGGSVGGPILKDRTFFFATYEGLRAFLGATNTTTTLGTLANPNGCKGGAGAVISLANCPQLGLTVAPGQTAATTTATILPQMAPFINLYPAPNLPGTANNYGFVFDQITPEDYGQIRIDHKISDKDNFFGRYTIDQSSLPYVGSFNQSESVENSRNQFLTLAENHTFSGSLINSGRFSFTREPLLYSLAIKNPLFNTAPYQLVPGLPFGSMGAAGVGTIGTSVVAPRFETENIFTVADDVSYNRGHHSLKFGFIFNNYQYYVQQHGADKGTFTFSSLAGMMQGGPLATVALTVPGANYVNRYFRFNTMGFYAQDSWKVTSRLTLNYGLRYEPTTTTNEIHGNAGTLRDFPNSATFTLGREVFTNPSLRNWSPRLGFAYDVFGNGKTAVRGGFDILYDLSTYGTGLANTSGFGPPLSQNISVTNYTQTYGTLQVPVVLPAPNTFQVSFRGIYYKQSQPHLLSYNVGVQQQLPYHMAITLAYAGSHGINLTQNIEGNNVLPNGVPGVDARGNRVCNEVPFGTALDNSNQYDGPAATSCYGISTTTNPQCWPAAGKNPNTGAVIPGNTSDCWSRQNSNLLSMAFVQNTGESFYNALTATLNKSISHGLQFQAAYTYSKMNDNTQGETTVDGTDVAEEPLHTNSEYGPSLFDLRNNFHFDALYRFPNFASSTGFLSKVVDGWGMNGIVTIATGYPFSAVITTDRENISYLPGYASRDSLDVIPGRNNNNITKGVSTGCTGVAAGTKLGTPQQWYDPCAFSIQAAGFIGNEPRNFLRGPGLANVDYSVVKDTKFRWLGEAGQVEFRAEFFDLFNHPNFVLPNQSVSSGSCAAGTANPLAACPITVSNGAGTIAATISNTGALPGGDRQIQFGLKLMF